MKHPIFLVFILLTGLAFGQNKNIDSLRTVLPGATGENRIKTLLELCWEYRFINADTARQFGLKALDLSKDADNEELEVEALNYVGVTHEAQGNYREALALELESLKIRKKLGDDAKTAKTLNDIGIIYDEMGDYQKALEYYFEARRIFERLDDPSKIAMVITNIGIVLKAQKEYEKVVRSYHEALSIYRKLNNKFGVAACDANLGAVYFSIARYDSSLYYSLLATREFEEQKNRQFLAMTLCNAGMAYDKIGDEASAREYLVRAQKLNEEYDNKKELSYVLTYLAGIERKSGDLHRGLALAGRGLNIAEKIRARAQIMEARKELSELKAKAGDFKGALEEHRKYEVVKDSLFQQEKARQVAELQTRYETEKKEQAIQLLTQENELKDFRLLRSQFVVISLVALMVVLIAVGFLWRNRIKLKQKAELEATRAELKEIQLQAVITSQEAERKRFAADLHDGMGQMISALRLNLSQEALQKNTVNEAVNILNEMNVEIRKIAFNLMPQVLLTSGITEALSEFSNRINRTGKVHVTVQAFDIDPNQSPEKKIALYRICQEWVNNILKYSKADKVSIQLVQHERELVITIEDNGEGFDTQALMAGQGNGWKNINSRLGMVGGFLEIDSSPGRRGTTLVITVPENQAVSAA